MQIKIPRCIGKKLWMRRLPRGFRVNIKLKPNHPEVINYYLMR